MEGPKRKKFKGKGSGKGGQIFILYNPAIERWLNRDPLEEDGGENLYGFVEENPVNLIDPTGLYYVNPFIRNYFIGYIKSTIHKARKGPFGAICGQAGTYLATWIPDSTKEACQDHDDCYEKCAKKCAGEDCKKECDEEFKKKNKVYGWFVEEYGDRAYNNALQAKNCECPQE